MDTGIPLYEDTTTEWAQDVAVRDTGVVLYDGEIKSCPFCGRDPVMIKDIRYPRPECNPTPAYEIVCNTFGCPIYKADYTYFFTKEEAAAAWNRRA